MYKSIFSLLYMNYIGYCTLLTGLCKAGSARRIIGSPRQLENAAPTNKNPHGVWV